MSFNIIKTDKKYYSYRLENDCEYMSYEYENFFYNDFGKSVLGRKIFFIRLGIGKNKKLIITGCNANDYYISLAIMCFIEKFLQKLKNKEIYIGYNLEELWNEYSFYFIPMLNPDGVDLVTGVIRENTGVYNNFKDISLNFPNIPFPSGWKANFNGVDFKNCQPFHKVL